MPVYKIWMELEVTNDGGESYRDFNDPIPLGTTDSARGVIEIARRIASASQEGINEFTWTEEAIKEFGKDTE